MNLFVLYYKLIGIYSFPLQMSTGVYLFIAQNREEATSLGNSAVDRSQALDLRRQMRFSAFPQRI
jgi:hypothetical protein